MRIVLRVLALSCVVVALTGCANVTGYWKMESIKPEAAKAHFQMERMCLCQDGTYCTKVDENGKPKCMSGKYTYDAGTKTLKFTTDGKERIYQAELVSGKLKVWEEGKDWQAMMVKAECPMGKDCPCKSLKSCAGCEKMCQQKCGEQCPMMKKGATPGEDKKVQPKKKIEPKAEPVKPDTKKAAPAKEKEKTATPPNK